MFDQLLNGPVLAGVVIGAPLGPVGHLALSNLAAGRPGQALACGGGSSLGDACWAVAAVLGVETLVPADLKACWAAVAVALFALIAINLVWKAWTRPTAESDNRVGGLPTAFMLTLVNPGVMAGYVLWFSATSTAALAVSWQWIGLGVFLGSLAWWLLLVPVAYYWRDRLANMSPRLTAGLGALLYLMAAVGLAWKLVA